MKSYPVLCALFSSAVLVSVSFAQQAPTNSGKAQEADKPSIIPETQARNSSESWTDIKLDRSQVKARPVAVGEIDKHEKFTRERLQVQWRNGDPIDLYIMKPAGVEKPPVIVYLASFPSETTRFMRDDFAAHITKSGFAAVGFVSAMTGQRFQNRPMKEWFISELDESLVSTTHDVQMILDYLESRNEFDMKKVGMFGTGSGASIAILSAAADPRIKAIDLLDPWASWQDFIAKSPIVPEKERAEYQKEEYFKRVAPLDPIVWLPKITIPARLQLIKEDGSVPDASKLKVESAAPPSVKVEHFQNAQLHYAVMSDGRLFNWIKDQLQGKEEISGKDAVSTTSSVQK